jgi:hypothetical protein
VVAGFLTAFFSFVNPVAAVMMFLTFIIYELDEDWHLSDKAFRDILEYGIGLYVGAVVYTIISCGLIRNI